MEYYAHARVTSSNATAVDLFEISVPSGAVLELLSVGMSHTNEEEIGAKITITKIVASFTSGNVSSATKAVVPIHTGSPAFTGNFEAFNLFAASGTEELYKVYNWITMAPFSAYFDDSASRLRVSPSDVLVVRYAGSALTTGRHAWLSFKLRGG